MDLATRELGLNREKGFVTVWTVARNYEILDGKLWRVGGRKKIYAPMTHAELPGEIAKLRNADNQKLLSFASLYGWLGYGFFQDRPHKQLLADPLPWIWAHSRTVHLCLELIHALKLKDSRVATKKIKDIIPIRDGYLEVVFAHRHHRAMTIQEAIPKDLRQWARRTLLYILNKNIQGIRPTLCWDEDEGTANCFFTFSALIEVVYWQLTNTLTGGWVAKCQTCGAFFIQTDRRQRFCPKGLHTESVCANRQRTWRFREKQLENSKNSVGKSN